MTTSEAKQEVKPVKAPETQYVRSKIENLTDEASLNAYYTLILPKGSKVSSQGTFRHGMTADLFVADVKEFYKALSILEADGGDEPYIEFWSGKTAPVSPANPATPESPMPTNGKKEYPNEFPASRLTAKSDKGKVYFAVEGVEGKFPKFPVTVWPEVLTEAGINADEVPVKGLPLTGWTAVYEKNDKGSPKKVTALKQPDFVNEPA